MSVSLSLRELEAFDPHNAGGGVERRFLCPLCGEGKPRDAAHRSLVANTQSGMWLCHRCGEKGKLAEWKSDEPPMSRKTRTRRHLREAFSLDAVPVHSPGAPPVPPLLSQILPDARPAILSIGQEPTVGMSQIKNPTVWRQSLQNLLPLSGTPGERYLLGRGLPLDLCHAAGVRFSPSWFGRAAVVFAIRTAAGELVAAQGRYTCEGRGPKVRTAGDKKAGVFATAGLWEEVGKGAPVVVCEAPIDALSIALCGYPALALCGKDGWPPWLAIRCAFKRGALAFDADEAGDAGAAKLHQALSSLGAQPFRLRPEGGKDWNQLLMEQGRARLTDTLATALL